MSAPKSAVVCLEYPLNVFGKTISEVALRRPTVADYLSAQRAGGGNQADAELQLFCVLSGLTPQELGAMDMTDYVKLQKSFSAFFASTVTPT